MIDLVGQKFGRLTAMKLAWISPNRHTKWLCRCECGTEKIVFGSCLRSGATKSCGCLLTDILIKRNTKHGKRPRGAKTPEYVSWIAMNQRCHNPKHRHFHRYGGRGITVDKKWRDSFGAFLHDMGTRPPGHTLDRIDNDGNYCMDNCEWSTTSKQNSNRSTSHLITIGSESKTISEWCRINNIKPGTVVARLRRGWDPERAVSTVINGEDMKPKTASQVGKSNVRRSKSHERRVAKLLSEWSGIEFRRRRVEGRNESTIARESTADVIAVDQIFRFSVEAKCGKGFSIDALLASPETAIFTSWWFQASYDAELLSKFLQKPILPMLFFKPSPNFDWVAVPISSLEFLRFKGTDDDPRQLVESGYLKCITYYYPPKSIDGDISHGNTKQIIKRELPSAILCRWKDFAATVEPSCSIY